MKFLQTRQKVHSSFRIVLCTCQIWSYKTKLFWSYLSMKKRPLNNFLRRKLFIIFQKKKKKNPLDQDQVWEISSQNANLWALWKQIWAVVQTERHFGRQQHWFQSAGWILPPPWVWRSNHSPLIFPEWTDFLEIWHTVSLQHSFPGKFGKIMQGKRLVVLFVFCFLAQHFIYVATLWKNHCQNIFCHTRSWKCLCQVTSCLFC